MLDFRILGPVEVVEQQRRIALGGPRQRALLAMLVLRRGEVVTSDRLIDQLWGERPPATAAKTLQGYISHLRSALGDGVLVTRGGGYALAVEADQVDAERFKRLVADGRSALTSGDADRAGELLGSALELWRGEALADLAYEPWAAVEVARLEEARLAAVEDRIEADLIRGGHRDLVGELESLVASHPHRERLRGQLMLALYRSGRQAEALEVYRRGRQALDDELGLEPGPELRALEQRILDHDPALGQPAAAAPASARPLASRRWRLSAVAGGLLLAAAIAAAVAELTGGSANAVRVAPNSVAAIDIHSNEVVAAVPVGARPNAIAFGSGSLWITNADDQTVSRVDPRTLLTQGLITLADSPTGVAAARGSVWVAGASPSASSVPVSRIDPQFDSIDNTVRVGNVVPDSPVAVAARGGSVWVAPNSGPLVRLDARTGRIVTHLDPNAAPAGVASGAGGVWVTDSEADIVNRVDPTGLVTSVPVGHGPSAIAVGDGGVWVADTLDDSVVRIDPATHAETMTIPVGGAPTGIAVGAGSVWIANSGDGTVTRIDPATDRVTATIAVGGSPQAVAIAAGRVWVTIDARTLPAPGAAPSGGTQRVDFRFDVDYMDPALAYGTLSWQLLYATCAKLVNYPDQTGAAGSQLVPEVAQSLPTISDEGRTYTFAIRKGFRFSPPSNAPVTAETFKYSIERTLNPAMKSPVGSEFAHIVGARAYMAGKATHIVGIIARGNTLTIRLNAAAPDLLSRVAEPGFCAVPTDTPIDPNGERTIPMAGPYRIASYVPGQGILLTRNPNYHGNRPRRLARIEVAVDVPGPRAVGQVEAGSADYANNGELGSVNVVVLDRRYGPGSPAARAGHQQYFVNAEPELDFLALNTHRSLFADARLRRAVSYAINRAALAALGDALVPLPERPTDRYIVPGVPGHSDTHVYPMTPDVAEARQLAGVDAHRVAVLYTCDVSPCQQQAQIITNDLAAIGVQVEVKQFPIGTLFTKERTPGEPFDIAWAPPWEPDYDDPDALLNVLLESGTVVPTLIDRTDRTQLAAAALLSGEERYLTYEQLETEIVRDAAPLVAFGNATSRSLFSARIGCQVDGVYGMDLAALCVRRPTTAGRTDGGR